MTLLQSIQIICSFSFVWIRIQWKPPHQGILIYLLLNDCWDFPGSSAGEEYACNAGDPGVIPGSGRSPGEGIGYPLQFSWASLMVQMVKNLSAVWGTRVGKIPWRRAWQPTLVFWPEESPWTEEPGGLQFMGSQRVSHDWVTKPSTAYF